jgi:hypothetical protein
MLKAKSKVTLSEASAPMMIKRNVVLPALAALTALASMTIHSDAIANPSRFMAGTDFRDEYGPMMLALIVVPALLVFSRYLDVVVMKHFGVIAPSRTAMTLSRTASVSTLLMMFGVITLPIWLMFIDAVMEVGLGLGFGLPLWLLEGSMGFFEALTTHEIPIPYYENNGNGFSADLGMSLVLSMVIWILSMPWRVRDCRNAMGISLNVERAVSPFKVVAASFVVIFMISFTAWFAVAMYSAHGKEQRHVALCSDASTESSWSLLARLPSGCRALSEKYPEIEPNFMRSCEGANDSGSCREKWSRRTSGTMRAPEAKFSPSDPAPSE